MIKYIYKKKIPLIIISIFILWFVGLFNYKEKIVTLRKSSFVQATNIVILTGGSNRIKDGLKIIKNLENSAIINTKLLISGTGKGFTISNVKKLLPKNKSLNIFLKCCIELDNKSQNTHSNAIETLKWAKKKNIKTFILITSNYHMPRAVLEFKARMPNFEIITHPITPKKHDISNWMHSFETFSLIFIEYSKFLIAISKIKILNFQVI